MKGRNSSEVEDKVKAIIAKKFKISADKVKGESRLVEDLGADSLTGVEIVMEIEAEFGISIPDEDTRHFSSVKDIIEYVTKDRHQRD